MIRVRHEGEIAILTFSQRALSQPNVPSAGDLVALVKDKGERKLILDLKDVNFLSSTRLADLIVLRRALQEVGGQLKLCCIVPEIQQVFEITRLSGVFPVFDTLELAMQSYTG